MKKIILWLGLLLGITLSTAFYPGHQARAADDVTITLHHQPGIQATTAGRGQPATARFAVYDLTPVYVQARQRGQSITTIQKQLATKDTTAMAAYVQKHELNKVTTVMTNASGTADFTVSSLNGRAYVVVQETSGNDPNNALTVNEMSMPITFSLPLKDNQTHVDLYTKAVRVQRAVYFYKYARGIDETAPLAGAKFAIKHVDSGKTTYLTATGQFVTSAHPLTDTRVLKLTSAKTGLVLLADVPLAAGKYVAIELKAPSGYRITTEAKRINVVIPSSATKNVTVNGATLRPLLAGSVQPNEAQRSSLWVYNDLILPHLPDTGGNPPGNPSTGYTPKKTHHGFLPQTGETKANMMILGIIMLALTIYYLSKTFRKNSKEND